MPRMINGEAAEELAEVDVEASRDGSCGQEKQNMKKGPWTAAEDAILIEYVKKYGEGNWNSVQRNSGLSRCGKSCRLRWANHLRPNLKKGAFSQEEEQIIIELHAKLGNKWARMASQLPGRTDNEIKNFWNTRMKRRQRAGLPLYPPEVQDEAALYHLHQHHQYFPVAPPTQSSPTFSFSSLLSSSTYPQNLHQQPNYSDSAHDSTNQFQYQRAMGVPLVSCVSPDGFNYGFDYSSGATLGLNTEISSSQSETPASSYSTSGIHGLMGGSGINNKNASIDYYEVAPLSSSPEGNSGLLDALVVEAQALSRTDIKSETTKSEDSTAGKRLSLKRKTMTVDQVDVNDNGDTRRDDLNSSQLYTGKKAACYRDALEETNAMDDDLFSLLNNFPSEMPVPEWYRKGERQSVEVENQKDASQNNTDQQLAWTLGTCWNNMPSIC